MIGDLTLQAWLAGCLHAGNRRKLPKYFHFPGVSKGDIEDLMHWASTESGKAALHAELTRALAGKN